MSNLARDQHRQRTLQRVHEEARNSPALPQHPERVGRADVAAADLAQIDRLAATVRDPKTGKITASTADHSSFDLPTSLAFGRGPLDHKSVFVVNSGFFPEGRPEAAPSVVQVGVGQRGGN